MFRHKNIVKAEEKVEEKKEKETISSEEKRPIIIEDKKEEINKPIADATTKELLEKNLKWSQIIYEQNRKINNKLLWLAIGNWIKVFLILIPLILAVLFLAPIVRNFSSLYSNLLLGNTLDTKTNTDYSLEQIMKLFPLNSAQQEQLKALFK